MAFNIRSRAGWLRLWLALAVLWWVYSAWFLWGGYPTEEVGPGRFSFSKSLAERQEQYLIEVAVVIALPFLVYILVYALVLVTRWIIHGFTRPSA